MTSRLAADLGRRALGERPALVEHVDPVADPHHERHVVVDQEHAGVEVLADRPDELRRTPRTSASGRPAPGSSSSTNAGSVASARATPSRRSWPCGSSPADRVPVERRAAAISSSARARAVARPGARRRAPRPRCSRERSALGTSGCAGRSARSRRGRAGAGSSRSRPARSSSTLPEVGASNPVSTFTSVDLPAPFGPIRPTTSCRCSSSVTSSSACTPVKDRETEEARSVPPGLLVAAAVASSANV